MDPILLFKLKSGVFNFCLRHYSYNNIVSCYSIPILNSINGTSSIKRTTKDAFHFYLMFRNKIVNFFSTNPFLAPIYRYTVSIISFFNLMFIFCRRSRRGSVNNQSASSSARHGQSQKVLEGIFPFSSKALLIKTLRLQAR